MNQKQWIQVEESAAINDARIRKSTLVVSAVPAVVLVVAGLLLRLPFVGLVAGLVVFFAAQRLIGSVASGALSGSLTLREMGDDEHSRLFNIVDGLCVVSGDQRPRIYVVDTSYPVAAAFIDDEGDNAVVVSEAFMTMMDRVEIEGVMAHLLWRLRTGNVALVAHLAALSSVLGKVGLSVIAQRFTRSYLSPDVLTWADIFACQATRYPPALASALEKCEAADGAVNLGPVNALCFALPSDAQGDALSATAGSTVVMSRSSMAERIAILKEM